MHASVLATRFIMDRSFQIALKKEEEKKLRFEITARVDSIQLCARVSIER